MLRLSLCEYAIKNLFFNSSNLVTMFEAANLIQNEKQHCASKIDESTRLLSPSGNPGTLGYVRLDLESNENLGRDTLTSESNVAKWQIGIFLAALSGILFTANNFLIQVSIF